MQLCISVELCGAYYFKMFRLNWKSVVLFESVFYYTKLSCIFHGMRFEIRLDWVEVNNTCYVFKSYRMFSNHAISSYILQLETILGFIVLNCARCSLYQVLLYHIILCQIISSCSITVFPLAKCSPIFSKALNQNTLPYYTSVSYFSIKLFSSTQYYTTFYYTMQKSNYT